MTPHPGPQLRKEKAALARLRFLGASWYFNRTGPSGPDLLSVPTRNSRFGAGGGVNVKKVVRFSTRRSVQSDVGMEGTMYVINRLLITSFVCCTRRE